MKKTVYSLVLSSEVIAMVDQAAYLQNTSRSALINQVLAEYVSYTTPEKRLEEIYAYCEAVFAQEKHFQMIPSASEYTISLRSPLPYKYNPAIKYCIEIYPDNNDSGHGEVRASIRSSSDALIKQLRQFFQLWTKIEQAYGISRKTEVTPGKYTRVIHMPDSAITNVKMQGETLADYICAMDGSMKGYFENLTDMVAAVRRIETHYVEFLKKHNEAV